MRRTDAHAKPHACNFLAAHAPRVPGYQAWDQYGDESKVFAPYVKECMMCPANKDDVRKSFDHPHKCHHDKHRKHGILMHDDDVPMPSGLPEE